MSDIFDTLITDRPDVNTYYNISDLNRVEEAVKQLAQRMTAEGYYVTPKAKTPTELPEIENPTAPDKDTGENVYTPVEYIQSSGTQCIDTKFTPNNNSRVVLDLQLLSNADVPFVFGTWAGNISQAMSVYWFTSTYNSWGSDYGTSRSKHSQTNWNKRLVIDLNKGILTIDGISQTLASQTFTSPATLVLLGLNSPSGINTSYRAKAIVYACQIYDNDILVRDFIPVIDSSGVALLYDRLNGVPYYNAGTGSFTFKRLKGEVEYIESTGTQYIDTGTPLSQNGYFEIDFQFTKLISNDDDWILGTYNGQSAGMLLGDNGQVNNVALWSRAQGLQSTLVPITERCKFIYNLATGKATVNGADMIFNVFDPGTLNALLFRRSTSDNPVYAKLYSFKYKTNYNNSKFDIDYVPWVDDDGVVCLFDKVTQTYFYNAGSGTFNAGALVIEEGPDDGENEDVLPNFAYDIDPYIWNIYDIPTDKETGRYISNLFLIRRQIAQNQLSLPNDMEGFNYVDANNIEMMLFVVDNLVEQMIAQYRRCNTFRCGEGR